VGDFANYVLSVGPWVVGAVALGVFLWALLLISATSATGVVILLGAIYVLENAPFTRLGVNLGLWIYPDDLFGMLASGGLAFRLLVLRLWNRIPAVWWAFGVVQVAVFLWGVPQYRTAAAVEFRPTFYVWVGAALLSTFGYRAVSGRRYAALLIGLALALCAIACYRWGMASIDPEFERELLISVADTGIWYRVITSGCAFVIALAMLACIHYAASNERAPFHFLLAVVFAGFVLVLQHRSVWLASFAGATVLVYAHSQKGGAFVRRLSAALVVITAAAAVGASSFGNLSESVQTQAQRAVDLNEGTSGARVEGWEILLREWATSGSPVTYLAGRPNGSGFTRYQGKYGENKIEFMPHNYYVVLLLRGGLIQIAVVGWLLVSARRTLLRRMRDRSDGFAPALAAMFVALVVYWITYSIETPQLLVIGPVLAAMASDRVRRDTAQATDIVAEFPEPAANFRT